MAVPRFSFGARCGYSRLTVGIVGPLGDLSESLIKRDVGVKDSSNLLADHGGFFDRFDSIIASAPFVYLYLKNFIEL